MPNCHEELDIGFIPTTSWGGSFPTPRSLSVLDGFPLNRAPPCYSIFAPRRNSKPIVVSRGAAFTVASAIWDIASIGTVSGFGRRVWPITSSATMFSCLMSLFGEPCLQLLLLPSRSPIHPITVLPTGLSGPTNSRRMTKPATPNQALQRTRLRVTAPASATALPPTMQVPRRSGVSLSLRSLGVATFVL